MQGSLLSFICLWRLSAPFSEKMSFPQPPTRSFVSASLGWYNIGVSSHKQSSICGFTPDREATRIIKNGDVPAGSTLAIMGSSGAGKTTLLNVLTARNLSNFVVEGCVKINGQIADVSMITSMSAYVQQQDLFLATLTVREHLVFQALIRMDPSISDELKAQRINEVMKELSLEKCADTIVGGTLATGKGISGGELKRLAFATEILTNPSIMFCDEPTSGLDSFMAENLVSYLNKMAAAGRTIICTIHQPSTDVFNLFQNLLLMADGRVAFMGPTQSALNHFALLGMHCPANFNPADFYVKELAVIPGKEAVSKKKVNRICDHFQKSQPKTDPAQHRQTTFVQKEVKGGSPYKVPWFLQYQTLAWRAHLITLREPLLTYVRVGQAICVAIIVGMFFYNQKYDQRGTLNINGALFLLLLNLSLQNAFAVVNVFCQELPVFLREHGSGMYRVDAYFFCKNLAEIPVFVMIPICASSINYYMIGYYPTFDAYLYLVMVGIVISAIGVSFGYFISCVCNNTDLALAVGPPIIIPLQLLGGYYLNSKTIPSYLAWAQLFSWFYYGFSLLAKNQWTHIDYLDCTPIGSTTGSTTAMTTPAHHHGLISTHGPPQHPSRRGGGFCLKDGHAVLDFLDLGNKNESTDFLALIAILLGLRILAFIAIYLRAKYSR